MRRQVFTLVGIGIMSSMPFASWQATNYISVSWGKGHQQVSRGCVESDCDWENVVTYAVGPHGEVAVADWGGRIKLFTKEGSLYDTVPTAEGWKWDFTFGDDGGIYYLDIGIDKVGVIMEYREGKSREYFRLPNGSIEQLEAISASGSTLYCYVGVMAEREKAMRHLGLTVGAIASGKREHRLIRGRAEAIASAWTSGRAMKAFRGLRGRVPLAVNGNGVVYLYWNYDRHGGKSEIRAISVRGKELARAFVSRPLEEFGRRRARLGQDGEFYINMDDARSFRLVRLPKP
jgi:hypothetical protein